MLGNMEKNLISKWIKISIAIIIVIVIVIIGFLLFRKVPDETGFSEEEKEKITIQTGHDTEQSIKMQRVNTKQQYYTVKALVNTYMSCLKQANGKIGVIQYQEQEVKDEGLNRLIDLLGEEYVSDFHINKNKLAEQIVDNKKFEFDIREMYSVSLTSQINVYLVYGNMDGEMTSYAFKVDSKNMTFSVYPEEYMNKNGYTKDMSVSQLTINTNSIQQNDNNTFLDKKISDDYMALDYVNNFKKRMLNDTSYAYELLDKQYREKRFGSLDEFKKYVDKNKKEISTIESSEYVKNVHQDYIEYVCRDQYNNYYIFKSPTIMNYTVMLDTYTLDNQDEEFIATYNSYTDQYKVANNINKWLQMMNNRDYKTAFSVLDESFRKNIFQDSVDKFEEYMRHYFPHHYDIEFKDYSTEAGIHAQRVIFIDLDDKDQKVEHNFVMQLQSGTDFVMSFKVLAH